MSAMSDTEQVAMLHHEMFGSEYGSQAGDDACSSMNDDAAPPIGGAGHGDGVYFFNTGTTAGGRIPPATYSDHDQCSESDYGGEGPRNQGGYGNRGGGDYSGGFASSTQPHVRNMPGYDPMFLGHGITSHPPAFHQGGAAASGWVDWEDAMVETFTPKRASVFHVPVECLSRDATRMTHWQTPMQNPTRATDIAALLGLLYTPTSKGWLSGRHEEIASQGGDEVSENGAQRDKKHKKTHERVFRYMYRLSGDMSVSVPMFVICYEEIYDSTRTKVLAIRIWKLVFDQEHSDSELMRKLMDENHDQWSQAGVAHAPNSLRRAGLVNEHKTTRQIAGSGSVAGARLEYFAGTQYLRIITENVYQQMLPMYAGAGDKGGGKHAVVLGDLPIGTLNRRIEKDGDGRGGDHPLAPEWVFNAKRPEALGAGLVHLNGEIMDVDPDQVDTRSYFDMETGEMKLPDWIKDEKQGFFFMTDPSKCNVFDLPLPRPLAGDVSPGEELLGLFRERMAHDVPLGSPRLLDLFKHTMTGADQWTEKHIREMAESIMTFDTAGCTNEERVQVKAAKSLISGGAGVRSYGMMDGIDSIIEPRQVLKDLAYESSTVHRKLIQPWVDDQRGAMEKEEARLRAENSGELEETPFDNEAFAELRAQKAKFKERHNRLMKELAVLHLSRMERAFTSRVDAETIPAGYRAVWDGLQRELEDMPDKTANIAFALDMQMTDSDRSVFAHMNNWIGSFFEDDCYVDGRDWRIMQELFYHCFEQFGETTLLLIFCGPKGNGKTLRTERAIAAFVEGWLTMSGPSSAKAGMQGNSDSSNGSNCVYDEMIDELTDSDGSNRTEYWKMILLKREYVYNKPIVIKGSDGAEIMRTMKLRTPHQETHCVCTNRGPAFTKGQEEPSEVKSALIDRAVVQFVRTLGSKAHSDDEFKSNMATTAVKRKVKAFRILTCLMGLTKMFIYRQSYFRPDMALAQKMWDEWDDGPKGLDRGFGLPKPTPRKNIKRMENCITMTVLDAVAEVFFYKQTAHKFECSQVDPYTGKCKPFDIKMLWEVVCILQPTPEIIHEAWSMGLEYSIGTSAMGFNATTALGDTFDYNLADYLKKPFMGPVAEKCMRDQEVNELGAANAFVPEEDAHPPPPDPDSAHASGNKRRNQSRPAPAPSSIGAWAQPTAKDANLLPELYPRFDGTNDTFANDEVRRCMKQFRATREARALYRHQCSRSAQGNMRMGDAAAIVDSVLGAPIELEPGVPQPGHDEPDPQESRNEGQHLDAMEEDDDDAPADVRGRRMWLRKEPPPSPGDKDALRGYHEARCLECPGPRNCPWTVEPMHDAAVCMYCSVTAEPEADVEIEYLAAGVSAIWPTQVQMSMFYKPQVLIQWCNDMKAFIDPSCMSARTATRKGARWAYKALGSGKGGSKRWDMAWKVVKNMETWFKLACTAHGNGGKTCAQFDYHIDGLKDCFYLMSTRDNSRRVCEDPLCRSDNHPENAFIDGDGEVITETAVLFKMRGFKKPGSSVFADSTYESLPRHPDSGVPDCEFQRKLDARFRAGKLPALNVLVSNRVSNSPPIRFNGLDLEISVSAFDDHYSLLAEAVCSCAEIPGLQNVQEAFCHNQPGPDGLSSQAANGKRNDRDSTAIHTLPYSYDIIPLFISLTMGRMIYDDYSEGYLAKTIEDMGATLGMTTKFEDLPHHSMRYIGLSESNRQTISIPREKKRSAGQRYVEAGDPTEGESAVSLAHVSRSLGRHASEQDLREHIQRKQGSRSMRGVRGDLFAYSTWLKHAVTSLEERGLLEGAQQGTPYNTLINKGSCLSARVIELASAKKLGGYGHIKLHPARPGTYMAVAKQEKERVSAPPAPKIKKARTDVGASSVSFLPTACILPGLLRVRPGGSGDGMEVDEGIELGGRRRCGP